ncbi:hypothetical protein HRI_002330900 [Hibiscus trionum]|uniref:DUF4283 domain-containing protein n=1 Tax=Hibiscus trionum TaxID=183268 RepID=A0A9W7M3W5_HIBTR|nr:hypothetical protein HRI_002330900 [Hibiscus trionum]
MTSNSFFQQFGELSFTPEEQGLVFTPAIYWDSTNDDINLLLIGKFIASKNVDNQVVIRAFQGIWKNNKIDSISILKENYFRIKFSDEANRNDILKRGQWTYKDEWLALAPFDPQSNIDDYTFNKMHIRVCIHGIPIILKEKDDIAYQIGNSLGAMIVTVLKIDSCRIDRNTVGYLRVEITIDVIKPIRRCVAIGGPGTTPKLCPIQYERLPTLCHGCGIIGHSVNFSPTFKLTETTKYEDWLRYIPPKRQEAASRSKGRI